jgi:glutamate-ammonia-ligase adenylyltransferase
VDSTLSLADLMRPCGPVIDRAGAERARERLGRSPLAMSAWPALEPIFAASPYLAAIAGGNPMLLERLLDAEPEAALTQVMANTAAAPTDEGAGPALRRLKSELHLLCALCDLGGVWDLDQVTGALTDFADAALAKALEAAAEAAVARGHLRELGRGERGPVAGFFLVAMGKHGARELNYSSDIDISVFYDPEALPLADHVEPGAFAVRLAQSLAQLMQDRTADGYVFRVDLRLRPDPSSTPIAVPVAAAFDYYESVGQNWERAAFIKARACAGDLAAGQAFLDELQPFVWRRNLDFAAIADIHSIKRQIHVHKVDERLEAKGADLKLGHGGIREIEFYVQTQQLILGGRDASLRGRRTVEALTALARAGHVAPTAAVELTEAYGRLRALEHRAQMIADQQTHKLPENDAERRRIAALSGATNLRSFDASVTRLLKAVNRRYGELFAEDEDLSSKFGSLVFTGVEDDPETLATLKRMGFSDPARVSAAIRAWHHGHIGATRTERGRELFTRLAPRLLEACEATGAPDQAFLRFTDFFAGLNSGVQVQSLFLAQPKLFELVVEVLAFAPRLATILGKRPAALDAMLDRSFFAPFEPGEAERAIAAAAAVADGFEEAMDAVRRAHRELAFRIGVQVIGAVARADQAGPAFADLADGCIRALAAAALAEVVRIGGEIEGEAAVVALGKCGSREMTAGSDLDLMTVYACEPAAMSAVKGWAGETFFARFTQRLVSALSAPTGEGGLYEVDLRLRPSGTQGPVAVSRRAFEAYYAAEAETWEFMALTRARVVWSTSPAFEGEVTAAIEAALRRPREPRKTAAAVREMRALIETEKPATGLWDLKLAPGGLVDIEFAAQFLQLVHAAQGGPLEPHTADALAAFGERPGVAALQSAWRLQQDLAQLLRVALADRSDPNGEPAAFRRLLASAVGVRGFRALDVRLRREQKQAREALQTILDE